VESVYVNPSEILEPERVARVLSSTLEMDQDQLLTKISSKKHFVWIKRKCATREIETLRQYDLSGVGFVS
jgi:cell division protein FtsI (penicillin-binding protein 3)